MDRVDQLPLPSLHWYAGFSGLALCYVLVYGVTSPEGLWATLWSDLWCSAAVLNMCCCGLFLLASVIQSIVFGKLQLVEQQHMRDKFWNFVFYKFIFVFGVLNVQEMVEMLGWYVWFAVLGTLLLTEQMCRDRFQLLSFSPNTVASAHAKVIVLLVMVFLSCAGLFMVCAIIGWQYGFAHFAFLYSEVFILFARSMHTIIRYIIHLWDMHHDGTWENRSTYAYYAEMILELAALSVEFLHHIHMLMWANMLLSVASLILLMKLRFLYQEIQRRLRRHRNYLTVSRTLENRFAPVPQEELASCGDVCAICWEKMSSARRLPCRHIFHTGCLRLWLEQDTVCPTCRCSLNSELQPNGNREEVDGEGEVVRGGGGGGGGWRRRFRRHRNWLLHFNGASIASWLPTFSVELHNDVSLGNGLADLHRGAQQVHSMFPHVPLHAILLDLADTRSLSLTVEHILNDVIYIPPNVVERSPHSTTSPQAPQAHTTPRAPFTPSPFTPSHTPSPPLTPPQEASPQGAPSDSAADGLGGQRLDGDRVEWVEPELRQTIRQRRRGSANTAASREIWGASIRDNHSDVSHSEGGALMGQCNGGSGCKEEEVEEEKEEEEEEEKEEDIMSFSLLQRRKRELLNAARRRYLLKYQ